MTALRLTPALWAVTMLQVSVALAEIPPVGDTPAGPLEEVVVTATRLPGNLDDLPFAAGVVSGQQVQRARQQLGLDEALASQPGIFFQNRYNFAQDLRIAIRGFGARANFGIRGIRIFADDIPQTLPDGQGSVDAIDLGSLAGVEIIRGPFAAVYGSSSGGVILLRTEDGPSRPELSARLDAGSYGFIEGQVKAGGQADRLNWLAHASSTRLDGYREQSTWRNDLFNGKFRYDFDEASSLTVLLNAVDSPTADDPGALTAAEAAANPRAAAPRNVEFDAGESLDQQTLGLAYRRTLAGGGELLLRNYYVWRDFENRLPFDINSNGQGGAVHLQRFFGGAGAQYGWTTDWAGLSQRLIVGLDYDAQRDHRTRIVNERGTNGVRTTDQDEDVTTRAVYIQDEIGLTEALALTVGGRYDAVEYRVTDHVGTDSGNRTFNAFSPMVGLNWAVRQGLHLYANVSTSFDPPATTELANPLAPTGFNAALDSQTATNYEIGLKRLDTGRARFELALFHIDVRDEIVPFELGGSGQAFFHNAGRSTHDGLEALLAIELAPGLTGSAAWTWSDFTFDAYSGPNGEIYDGNRIPGVPEQLFQFALEWNHPSGLYAGWDTLYAGPFFADDANTVETGDYTVSNVRMGYRRQSGRWSLEPFLGVNNVFDARYMSNIRINAAFGRYYEPAPGRNVYGGVRMSVAFF